MAGVGRSRMNAWIVALALAFALYTVADYYLTGGFSQFWFVAAFVVLGTLVTLALVQALVGLPRVPREMRALVRQERSARAADRTGRPEPPPRASLERRVTARRSTEAAIPSRRGLVAFRGGGQKVVRLEYARGGRHAYDYRIVTRSGEVSFEEVDARLDALTHDATGPTGRRRPDLSVPRSGGMGNGSGFR
jgi:hypothetical protein